MKIEGMYASLWLGHEKPSVLGEGRTRSFFHRRPGQLLG